MNVIQAVNLTKKFGDFVANDAINLAIEKGKITAIVGENGAGKTTLMNMFYGLSKPTSGELYINGKQVDFKSPQDAIDCGLGMVHQHFKLVPSLSVFENIMLGAEERKTVGGIKTPLIHFKKEMKAVQNIIDEYKFELNASDKVEDISIGAKQRVEILKMLYRNVDILIFDEPTAVLTPQEVDQLLDNLLELKQQGKTIILITHKLREIMKISDEVIIIKSGKIIDSMHTCDTSPEDIATKMVGRSVMLNVQRQIKDLSHSPVVYQAENLVTQNDAGTQVLDHVSFHIREGEILGVAGVEGNGQSELVKILTGLMVATEGKVTLFEQDITNKWPDELRDLGLAFIPEDRYAHGLCRDMSLADNMVAGYLGHKSFCKHGILQKKNINQYRDNMISGYDIRIAEKEGNVSQLSGGNAQKIIIAREFSSDPKVLIASQPTRGVDIGSIEFIYKKILELRDQGKAILLVSSELSEIMSLSDRIIVMYKGRVIGEVEGGKCTSSEIGLMMTGMTPDKEGEENEKQ